MDGKRDTRQAIIEAACELFALRGVDGAGVRAIVKAAGTALSSVNYHFENKEQLYEACIRYIVTDALRIDEMFDVLNAAGCDTPQAVSDRLYRVIRTLFYRMLSPETPKWYAILLIRAKHERHPVANALIESVTSPERIKSFLLAHIPGLDETEAFFWVFSLIGQLQHYIVSKPTVLSMFHMDDYDKPFIEAIVNYASSNLLSSLGLPEPCRDVDEP